MDVIALVGPSGTGKSHRALLVANQYKADIIIDDGLLIKDGKIIAGSSAKKEKSRIMAVRRAIFILPGHAEEARNAIEREQPNRMLILATSENMVHKIAKILRLPAVSRVIHIEDIASETDMKKAAFHRLKEGKHIIPVPTIELKPHFSGYLVDPAFGAPAPQAGREVHRAPGVQLLRKTHHRRFGDYDHREAFCGREGFCQSSRPYPRASFEGW